MPGARRPRSVRLMGGTNSPSAGRRYRRARRLHHERRGVVAVIGTLLALLVFFALFGIFLTQYVPLWMTDNESLLVAQSSTSFATFKSIIDEQYALDGPQTVGTPFPISSQGVPLIAQPTEGTLTFLPNSCPGAGGVAFYSNSGAKIDPGNGGLPTSTKQYGQPISPAFCAFVNITESTGPGGYPNFAQAIATGSLQMQLPNRYYTPENFYFQDDAVVQSQSIGYQVIAVPPPLNISTVGANTTVTGSFLQLYGNSSSIVGQGSEEVYSQLKYSTVQDSNGGGSPFTFYFEIGTQDPCAWNSYLYSVLISSGLPLHTASTTGASYLPYDVLNYSASYTAKVPALYPVLAPTSTFTGNCFASNGQTTVLGFTLYGISYAETWVAGVQVTLGVGAT